jgi:hypothetical protein
MRLLEVVDLSDIIGRLGELEADAFQCRQVGNGDP